MASNSYQNRSLGRHRSHFFSFREDSKGCFFYELWVGENFASNRKCQRLWPTKKIWRCAGEEKEEGLSRTVDCVFKT